MQDMVQLETRLLNEYSMSFQQMGMSPTDAMATTQLLLKKAKEKVQERGWSNRPPNEGDSILQQTPPHPLLGVIRQDGVRDEEVRWWWNMPPLERLMIEQCDEFMRMAAFTDLMKRGYNADEAAKRVFRAHALFGDPRQAVGEDRPLPIELKGRTVQFMEWGRAAPDQYRALLEQATSFNAIIRALIRAGKL
jgi:hypothetical protein